MVKSALPKNAKITIKFQKSYSREVTTYNLAARDIIGDIVVNWGRDSIYNAPRNRTASFTIADRSVGIRPGDWLCQQAEITVGGVTVFNGTIDHARVRNHTFIGGVAVLLIECDAVEGGLFNEALFKEKDVWINDKYSPVDQWANEMRAAGIAHDRAPIDRSPVRFAKFYEPVKMTMMKSLEMAYKSISLVSQPQWMPDHRLITCTIPGPWRTKPTEIFIPARNLEVGFASATLEKTPKELYINTGGEFGNKTPWFVTGVRPGKEGTPGGELNSPIQWDHNLKSNESLAHESVDLCLILREDPQELKVYDTIDKPLGGTYHLMTWELPNYGVIATGQLDGPRFINPKTGKYDPVRGQNLYTENWWYPIGGQLRISAEQVSHRWNAIKLYPKT